MKKLTLFLAFTPFLLSGCRSDIAVQSDLPKIEQNGSSVSSQTTTKQSENKTGLTSTSTATVSSPLSPSAENMQSEAAVAHTCVEAWKVAVQQKDEAKAMEMLEKLAADNPNISTVRLMMGQVKDYFKKPKEALVYYRKAYAINKFSSIQTLRLAGSLRKNGQFKEAQSHYDRLLKNLEMAMSEKHDEDLVYVLASVRTGKAACLEAAGEKDQAREMVKKALTEDPGNLEAKELLKKLGG